jgi:hypothetical protein
MMTTSLRALCLPVIVLWIIGSSPAYAFQTTDSQKQAAFSGFRVIRSICGSKGSQRGDLYIVEDQRTTFYLPEDRQVVFYMELDGPVGDHRIEGYWKSPSGIVASIADFRYTSQERTFSVHLSLAVLESAMTGSWMLELRVDGERVAQNSFQLIASARPADAVQAKKLIGPAEIYQRALASTVTVESIGPEGETLAGTTGFVAAPHSIVTSFNSIDGASKLRVIFPNGTKQETDQLTSWNRREDYAVILADTAQTPALPLASGNSWEIGDRVSYLDVAPGGNRVLSEVKIIGKNSYSSPGTRINLSSPAGGRAIGAALINEYGDAIGLIGGSSYPDGGSPEGIALDQPGPSPGRTAVAVPIGLVDVQAKNPTTLNALLRSGTIIPPVRTGKNILFAQLTHRVNKGEGRQWPADNASQLSRRDGRFFIFVTWDPKEKIKGVVNFFVYDADNNLIGSSEKAKELKVNLQPGRQVSTSWETNASNLAPGNYRIDVRLNETCYWRTFFRVTD